MLWLSAMVAGGESCDTVLRSHLHDCIFFQLLQKTPSESGVANSSIIQGTLFINGEHPWVRPSCNALISDS